MPTELSHPSTCRDDALNALVEIRACHVDLRTYVAGAFERLDRLVEQLRAQKSTSSQGISHTEQEAMQAQIDR